MNNIFLLIISMLACLLGGILKKYLGGRFVNKEIMYLVYNGTVSLVVAVSLLIIGGLPKVSYFIVVLGILFGIVTALQHIFNLKALERGLYSYTALIGAFSTIIPTLSGIILWNEHIAIVQVIGMSLLTVCIVCSFDFNEERKNISKQWYLYVMLTFLCTGSIGVMQKWHQNTPYREERDTFLIVAFAISFVYSAIRVFVLKLRQKTDMKQTIKVDLGLYTVIFLIISGICVAANNKINLYLSGVMDSAVFFPVVNGGGLILTVLASIVIFHEKLNLKKRIGVIAIVLICNPF